MNKFEKKQEEIEALKNCYDAIENKIRMETDYNQYAPAENEPLSDWQIDANERSEYRITVYRTIQQYIEKMI